MHDYFILKVSVDLFVFKCKQQLLKKETPFVFRCGKMFSPYDKRCGDDTFVKKIITADFDSESFHVFHGNMVRITKNCF